MNEYVAASASRVVINPIRAVEIWQKRKRTRYPALCGRQEYCGLRQSIRSSRQASCEPVSDTMPSFAADGQTNYPFSSRLA